MNPGPVGLILRSRFDPTFKKFKFRGIDRRSVARGWHQPIRIGGPHSLEEEALRRLARNDGGAATARSNGIVPTV